MGCVLLTVSFVDDERLQLALGFDVMQQSQQAGRLTELLRRDVQQLQEPLLCIPPDPTILLTTRRRIQTCSRHIRHVQRRHLILNKRYQRREDDGQAVAHYGGELVAE